MEPPFGDPTHLTPWHSARQAPLRSARSYLLTFDLAIEDNLLICWLTGVSLEGFAAHEGETRIAGNRRSSACAPGSPRQIVGTGGRVDVAATWCAASAPGSLRRDDTRVADNDVKLLTGAASTRK